MRFFVFLGLMAAGAGCGAHCELDGEVYRPGERFQADCNACMCDWTGDIACTAAVCDSHADDEGSDTGDASSPSA